MGRPPKAEDERAVRKAVSFPPKLWARFAERIPERERSAFIQNAVEKALNEQEGAG